ncbi:MAG: BMP family ABC transporter substrate-binding protein [Chloroflexota bacterium]
MSNSSLCKHFFWLCLVGLMTACVDAQRGSVEPEIYAPTLTLSPALVEQSVENDDEGCADAELFCIGFMTDVEALEDNGFYEAVWNGVQRSKYDLAARVTYASTVTIEEHEQQFESFVAEEYDVVVTAGYGLLLPTIDASEKYPNTVFVGVDQDQFVVSENLVGVAFPQEKAGFLAGVMAGLLTKSNTVGAILGTVQSPTYRGYRKGFEAGVLAVDPEIKVIVLYHPGGILEGVNDPQWGAGAADFMLKNKADVIFAAGGETAAGALTQTASTSTALCIGADIDQYEALPEARKCLVTSAVSNLESDVFSVVAQLAYGSSGIGEIEGRVSLAPLHDFDSRFSADVKLFFRNLEAMLGRPDVEIDRSFRLGTLPAIEPFEAK